MIKSFETINNYLYSIVMLMLRTLKIMKFLSSLCLRKDEYLVSHLNHADQC